MTSYYDTVGTETAFLFRYAPHYGIIMHTSYLPTGQRSRLKEVIQMQGVFLVRLLTFVLFVALLFSFSFRRLFDARQSTARVSLARVVTNTAPLEPNVVIANEVRDAVEVDDTDHVEFDLDELKEQLGIDSILEKLNVLAAKFCSGKARTATTEYSGSEAQNSKSSSETAEGVFDPSAAVVSHEVASTNELHEEAFKLPLVFEETESFGPEVAEVIAQRVNDACSKKAMDSKLKDLYEKYKTPGNCKYLCVLKSI